MFAGWRHNLGNAIRDSHAILFLIVDGDFITHFKIGQCCLLVVGGGDSTSVGNRESLGGELRLASAGILRG
jgi:hypothetical protein